MRGGRAELRTLPRGRSGRCLCRWCNLEVPKGRITFCSEWCVHEWKLRTDPGYLRAQVLARDHGVCGQCGLDCLAEYRRLKRARGRKRPVGWAEWDLRPGGRSSLWDAHHMIPVVEGGGECDLSNLRSLCLRCHRAATTELRNRRSGRPSGNAV